MQAPSAAADLAVVCRAAEPASGHGSGDHRVPVIASGRLSQGSPPWPVRGNGADSGGVPGCPVCGSVSWVGVMDVRVEAEIGEGRVDEGLDELPGQQVGDVEPEERSGRHGLTRRHRIPVEALDGLRNSLLAVIDDGQQFPFSLSRAGCSVFRFSAISPVICWLIIAMFPEIWSRARL